MVDETPSESDFLDYIRNYVGISSTYLPDDSDWIGFSYDLSISTVNEDIADFPGTIYSLAVYDLGTDILFNYAQDESDATTYETDTNGVAWTYFSYMRKVYGIYNFTAGVLTGSGDAGTSGTIAVSDALKELSIADLQNLKTPWGRRYLATAMKCGTLWGIS